LGGLEKNPSAVRALIDSIKIHSHEYTPISAVSKLFLSEESKVYNHRVLGESKNILISLLSGLETGVFLKSPRRSQETMLPQ